MKTNHCSEIHNYLNHKTSSLSLVSLKHPFFHFSMLSVLFFISFMIFFYFLFLSFITFTIPPSSLTVCLSPSFNFSQSSHSMSFIFPTNFHSPFSYSFFFSFYPFHILFVCLEKCLFWLQQCTMAWWEIIVRKQNSFLIFISFSHFPK